MRVLRNNLLLLSIIFAVAGCDAEDNTSSNVQENTPVDKWWQGGQKALQQRLAVVKNNHKAKNVILFVGDGMGISTITAARIFDGQVKGQSGEENSLSFEKFPHVALIKTYNTNAQVSDSAGTASALNTGVKTRIGVINTWESQSESECFGPDKSFPMTLAERAEDAGLSTGVVTTSTITHATPAAVYGHAPSRNWEMDTYMPKEAVEAGCLDFARQLVEFDYGDGIDVALGGGRHIFLPESKGGARNDGRNLIEQWQKKYPNGQYVVDKLALAKMKSGKGKLFGLFSDFHMAFDFEREATKEPSLAEMTAAAIDRLAQNEKGYFLMVEGARIDHAHHGTNAFRALSDTRAFSAAVAAALEKVNLDDTLVLVTADHSHAFTIAGYPERGNPILGLVRPMNTKGGGAIRDGLSLAGDDHPYTTLGYQVGPNIRDSAAALTEQDVMAQDFRQQTTVPGLSGHHGGEDVALFAIGPRSHVVGGVLEQHVIYHIMAHGLGWD